MRVACTPNNAVQEKVRTSQQSAPVEQIVGCLAIGVLGVRDARPHLGLVQATPCDTRCEVALWERDLQPVCTEWRVP